ncbi:MAG TPA: protein-export chaperone SecB [Gemmatimonadaceae bacterium]|nr:protein-export chaperone SecB [Gemmatimonadaceae bacterium]
MKHKVIPQQLSALRFESVWVREASFVDTDSNEPAPTNELEGVEIQLDVKVVYAEGGDRAYVTLRAVLEPPPDKQLFVRLSAAVEGTFTLRQGPDRTALANFASLQAPVLLVPYLRETITSLTAQSRLGAVLLPPLNMAEVIKAMQAQAKPAEAHVAKE